MISQEYLKKCLHYYPELGIFKWKDRYANKIAGSKNSQGYVNIQIDKKMYKAHRLAFLWMNGEFPKIHVDHINHIRDDNRFSNLRLVTNHQNAKNRPISKRNKTGFVGIGKGSKKNPYFVYGVLNGKQVRIGKFKNIDLAIDARKKFCTENDFHENHGSI